MTIRAKDGWMPIGDAAAQLNVSVDTLRRWAKSGLIKAKRSSSGARLFNVEEVSRLQKKRSGESDGTEYRVLKEDAIIPEATCVDLFAGAGGTALGFHNAGFNHVLLNEFDPSAAATLRENSERLGFDWDVVEGDVHELDFSGVEAEVIQAGFPCQAFSYAGKSQGFGDTRGTLFFEFARAVEQVRPKVAIGENVRGLEKHDGGRTLKTMLNRLNELGYDVAYRILRAQYLDVPQKRERLIMIAVRRDLDLPILFPRERDYLISMRQALKDCPESEGQKYPEKKRKVMELVPEGGNWRDLPEDVAREFMGGSWNLPGGRTGMARRMAWDEPCLTLTCAPAQKQTERCHPSETRPLTVREYARIQTFPDEWQFQGNLTSQYKQIGNAVPVNLGYHVARCVLAMLGYAPRTEDMEEVSPVNVALL
ncbi:DNA (cytosine-5-)-methyltransferase [Olsenella sp. YH-ols2217]|uniref:Cytosine-specific methyltransferase n=1 Tax=Kribbibacterium absianum TaxID=3044210 RepID=A0ABT6ZL98_9ACTN|nr:MULTISPECIES: DNA (cytosine-5-)-methyltransferase [unclassified Olsenella]MDJ1121810.1 DNA (cytosine-5-)-methyltransferase [Olsenella sp. YH-ols2216]MDJ1129818.1 DNA (cytosine-5-)-methyltransferase [Olsenella sp. YH-ols2217]